MSHGRQIGRCRKLTGLVLAAVALGATGAGCGADEEPADGRATVDAGTPAATQAKAPAGTARSEQTATQPVAPDDGRLTTTTGTVITDFGDPRQRRLAVHVLDRLQDDFRAGRMAAACRQINDFLIEQFMPPGTQAETPCRSKLEAYAAARARRGSPPVRMPLRWVRAYPGEVGVWVDDPRGGRLRIQLSSARRGTSWRLDLGPLNRPDILAAELVGADEY